ncbi:hypothetical protein HK096_005095 [Nowakowskiella sp. JEL0078]|nr:hypothetical protein HK096_005095 [Nowakowskiella sp. JEL0078]
MSEKSKSNFNCHHLTPEPSSSESPHLEHMEPVDDKFSPSTDQTLPATPSEANSKEQPFFLSNNPDFQTSPAPVSSVCRCAHKCALPIQREIEVNKTVFNRKAVDSLGRRAWTEHEDSILKTAVLHEGYGRWTEIAKIIKTRTPDACRKRWEKVLDPTIRKGPWTNVEDSMLISLVENFGKGRWTRIATQITGRTDKQCRQRWFEKLSTLEARSSLTSGQSMSDYAGYQRSPRKHVSLDQRKAGSVTQVTPGFQTHYQPISNTPSNPGFAQSHPEAVDPQSQLPLMYFQPHRDSLGTLPSFRDVYQPNYTYSTSADRGESGYESSQSTPKYLVQYPTSQLPYHNDHNPASHPLNVSYPPRITIPSFDSKSSGGYVLPPLRTVTE